jgi:hypothetical protein
VWEQFWTVPRHELNSSVAWSCPGLYRPHNISSSRSKDIQMLCHNIYSSVYEVMNLMKAGKLLHEMTSVIVKYLLRYRFW